MKWTQVDRFTFEKHESAVMSLVRCVNVSWQASPEVPNGHGVVIQHAVSPDPPEPATLWAKASVLESDTAFSLMMFMSICGSLGHSRHFRSPAVVSEAQYSEGCWCSSRPRPKPGQFVNHECQATVFFATHTPSTQGIQHVSMFRFKPSNRKSDPEAAENTCIKILVWNH